MKEMDQLEIIQEENTELIDNLFVPDVNSSDPDERKLARHIRIQKRIEAVARQHKGIEQLRAERAAERVTLLQKQLEKSSEVLHELFKEAEHQVTNVRVANDRREVDRRENDAVRRTRIYGQLHEDAKLSMEMFSEIASKWERIMAYNDPLSIHEDLLMQREKCEELLRQKDTVIAMIKHELHQAESRFYLDQQCQNSDIHILAKRVERQVTIMRAAHAVELQNIEDVMILERSNMMENNDKRWNEMYKRRKEQEMAISDFKVKQQQDFEETVTRARTKHYEKIREVKIALERDCGQLQKEFEYIKTSALVNSEKMDYNYQILKKREDENIIIKGNQKRLINKLQDTINCLREKTKHYEHHTKARVSKLCNEILSLQKSIKNEKKKSKIVAVTNDQKYMDIWELNRKAANKILKRIMEMDKLLYVQQLGITWREPKIKLQVKEKMPSYKSAVKYLEERYGYVPAVNRQKKRKKKIVLPAKMGKVQNNFSYRRLMRIVLEKLADNGGFLAESKINDLVVDASRSEQVLVKVDSVLDTLGINLACDVNVMRYFFRPYIYCPVCTPNVLHFGAGDEEVSSTDTTLSQLVDGIPNTDQATVGSNGFQVGTLQGMQGTMTGRESDKTVDTIVVSVLSGKRPKPSISDLSIVQKEGECIGPAQRIANAEKKMAQMVDHVTVMGDTDFEYCLLNHPLYMHPSLVMRALREFVTRVKCQTDGRDLLPSDTELCKSPQTISRLLNPDEIKEYWERYKVILASRTTELWEALGYGMRKYHRILEDRHRLNEELKSLQKQNKELRYLLYKFTSTPPNTKMKPPCAIERKSYEVMRVTDLQLDDRLDLRRQD